MRKNKNKKINLITVLKKIMNINVILKIFFISLKNKIN